MVSATLSERAALDSVDLVGPNRATESSANLHRTSFRHSFAG